MSNRDFEELYLNFFSTEDRDVVAKRYHIGNYLYNFNDKYSVINNRIIVEKQIKLNNVFKEISFRILTAARESNIQIAFVKGIFLSNYINSDCLNNRTASDIDVLIYAQDIETIIKNCKKYNLFLDYDQFPINIDLSIGHHHMRVPTEYIHQNVIHNIDIEFHYSFYPNNVHQTNIEMGLLESILNNTTQLNIDGVNFPILEPVDNIIFVSCHAIKHMIWDFMMEKCDSYISISNFYDVYKLLDLFYFNGGALRLLVEKAKEYGVLSEILLAHYIAYKIFAKTSCLISTLKNYLVETNPNSRLISLVCFYIIGEDFMNELFLPIDKIIKKVISLNTRMDNGICIHNKSEVALSKGCLLKIVTQKNGSCFYISFGDVEKYNGIKKIKIKYLNINGNNTYQIVDVPKMNINPKHNQISFFIEKDTMFRYIDETNHVYFDMLFINNDETVETFCENSQIDKLIAYVVGGQ